MVNIDVIHKNDLIYFGCENGAIIKGVNVFEKQLPVYENLKYITDIGYVRIVGKFNIK